MEEIVLIFSSVAGVCTAVALDKVPKIKRTKQTLTINSAITNQLHSLRMEKEILSKTIARLHQQESQVSMIQKDKLLLRYQHQLGTVISKIEKLELASKYPDLGPVGDSLISLMDNRLSQLDQRLHEISAKITITQTKQVEKPIEVLEKIQTKRIEPKVESQRENIQAQKQKLEIQNEIETQTMISEIQSDKIQEWLPSMEIPVYEKHRMVELSTLTEITNRVPQFPAEFIRPVTQIELQIPEKLSEPKVIQESILIPQSNIQEIKEVIPELPKPEVVQQEPEKRIQLPVAIKIPEEEKLEDDDKDLDKIKSEIMKALSKLEQVEVE